MLGPLTGFAHCHLFSFAHLFVLNRPIHKNKLGQQHLALRHQHRTSSFASQFTRPRSPTSFARPQPSLRFARFLFPLLFSRLPLFPTVLQFSAFHPAGMSKHLSPAQLAANKTNAQLSTGPATPDGKVKSSLNALTTALTGRTVLLPSDNLTEYEAHLTAYRLKYRPVSYAEALLVQCLADTDWRLARIPHLLLARFALNSKLNSNTKSSSAISNSSRLAFTAYARKTWPSCASLRKTAKPSVPLFSPAPTASFTKPKQMGSPSTLPIMASNFQWLKSPIIRKSHARRRSTSTNFFNPPPPAVETHHHGLRQSECAPAQLRLQGHIASLGRTNRRLTPLALLPG